MLCNLYSVRNAEKFMVDGQGGVVYQELDEKNQKLDEKNQELQAALARIRELEAEKKKAKQ